MAFDSMIAESMLVVGQREMTLEKLTTKKYPDQPRQPG